MKPTLKQVLAESRNGMNTAIRYSRIFPKFLISDGARDATEAAGCYWLLDILASEFAPVLMKAINEGEAASALLEITVKDTVADIKLTTSDIDPPLITRHVAYTDFPEGHWVLFEMGCFEWGDDQVKSVIATLLSEH